MTKFKNRTNTSQDKKVPEEIKSYLLKMSTDILNVFNAIRKSENKTMILERL